MINGTFISISVILCVDNCRHTILLSTHNITEILMKVPLITYIPSGALNQSESTHIQLVTYLKKSLGKQ